MNETHLINNLKLAFHPDGDDIVLAFDPKAEDSLIQFLHSRKMLYTTISHNKHSEASDALMHHLFKEIQKVFREHGPQSLGFSPDDSHIRIIMAMPDEVTVEDYLYVDDNVLAAFLKKLAASNDEKLGNLPQLAGMLQKSKPLPVFDFIKALPNKSESAISRAQEIFEDSKNMAPDSFSGMLVKRKPSYKDTDNPYNKIWVSNGGPPVEISKKSVVPDDIFVGIVFSESMDVIRRFEQALKYDPKLKEEFGGGYGYPQKAVPKAQFL